MTKRIILLITLPLLLLLSCKKPVEPRQELDFNFDWKFSLSNDIGSAAPDFDDSKWRDIRLPHDWSAELPFDSVNGEGCTGYVLGGIGWYRKDFSLDNINDKVVYIHFDGIYNHSEIWINGKKVKEQVSGYSPFYVDITPYLNKATGNNSLAVKVDRTRYVDSRWYSGSGIYRPVELIITSKLHIPVWGTFARAENITTESADILLDVTVKNNHSSEKSFSTQTEIFTKKGTKVAEIKSDALCAANSSTIVEQKLNIKNPKRWSTDKPSLYTAKTSIYENDLLVDCYETSFGIRSIEFDTNKGFFLNGESVKIKGLCLHQDAGLVGVAVPKGVWKRRLETLKEGGCNAIRVSHHPASVEFLELCDEMGFLVQDEFFDEWNYPKDKRLNCDERHDDYISRGYADFFEDNAQEDLRTAMLSHRNHPSIFQWSIGNEIEWTYPRNKEATGFFSMNWTGGYFWSTPPNSPEKIKEIYNELPAKEYNIGETAQQLAKWTKELDTTRPVIANCILPSVSYQSGYTDALDIVGFSYRRIMYDYAHEHYPQKPIMATESLPHWHEWQAVKDRDFISGLFLWTGVDYLGEATNRWPVRGISSGLLDVAGFKKAAYHMYKTLWVDEPHIHINTNLVEPSIYKVLADGSVVEKKEGAWQHALWFWHNMNAHWNYNEGDSVVVELFSNCEEVELFINDKSLGSKKLADFPDHTYKWFVPFEEGALKAVAKETSYTLKTAGEPVKLDLNLDKTTLKADGYDVAHIELNLLDGDGNLVQADERRITFEVNGKAISLGVDNGNLANRDAYKGNTVITHNGKALLIIQSLKDEKGEVSITASSDGIKSSTIQLKTL